MKQNHLYARLTEDEFFEIYQPITNPIDTGCGFMGCMFETYGEALAHVQAQQQNRIWTVVDGENWQWIINGYHLVNRYGYLVTKEPWVDHVRTEILLGD